MATHKPEHVENATKKLAAQVTEFSEEFSPVVRDFAEKAAETAVDSLDSVRKFAKENPIATIAAGVGIGLLLGAWLRRD